jgi:hypothetical protein
MIKFLRIRYQIIINHFKLSIQLNFHLIVSVIILLFFQFINNFRESLISKFQNYNFQ